MIPGDQSLYLPTALLKKLYASVMPIYCNHRNTPINSKLYIGSPMSLSLLAENILIHGEYVFPGWGKHNNRLDHRSFFLVFELNEGQEEHSQKVRNPHHGKGRH